MKECNNPVVSIVMITYDHENFIRCAIEGVLMQVCNFDFELIVANDCSLDATDLIIQSILNEHPKAQQVVYINHKKNLGMMQNFNFAMKNAKAKYIAFCEGDDYWTDPYKLQKQVDFLEANEDFGLTHGNIDFYYEESKKFEKYSSPRNEGFIFDNLLIANQITTLTVLVRKDLVIEAIINNVLNLTEYMADYSMWLYVSSRTKIRFFDEIFGVYRVLPESAFNTNDKIKKFRIQESISDVQFYFAEKFDKLNVVLQSLIGTNTNHLYFCAFNNLPGSGKKAYSFLKKYYKINWKSFLLLQISQNYILYRIFKFIKK